ncbi:MAG: hypothetical protein M3Q64_03310, partial [bacterium]|nr:hypothetical protein [bacterium]
LNDPNPVPITNHKMEEKPKKIAAEPTGIASFLPNKYLRIMLHLLVFALNGLFFAAISVSSTIILKVYYFDVL